MTRILLAITLFSVMMTGPLPAPVCLMAAMQKLPTVPAPGNPGHREPTPGVKNQSCNNGPNVDAEHACECHHACAPNLDSDGNPTFGFHMAENAKCRWYCFPKQCGCPKEHCPV